MKPCLLMVLVVSEDRRLLRHLSRFLRTFGYHAQPACGQHAAQVALEGLHPDVVLLDGSCSWAPDFCGRISAVSVGKPIQTLLMLERADARQLTDALASGVDDFLQRPIVYGELLSRMRAAARALGFEQGARRQEGIDPLTGLKNSLAFEEAIGRRSSQRTACVVLDLDWLEGVNRLHGRATGDALICGAGESLSQLAGEALLAHLGAGRFAALLSGVTVLEAEAWAEQARAAIARMELQREEGAVRITASAGLATTREGGPRCLAEACEALRLAKQSGRDCTVRAGQFTEETRDWSELAAPGRLFERTKARDVMVSLPLSLGANDPVHRAARLLSQTQLEALPVVGDDGSLLGVVTAETPLDEPQARVADVMERGVAAFDEETPFSTLLEFFTTDERGLAIIIHRQLPTGLLTPARLALLSRPVTLDEGEGSRSDTCTTSRSRAEAMAEIA